MTFSIPQTFPSVAPAPEWAHRAACLDADPEVFFPEKGRRDAADEAKAICAECPVAWECLEYALANNEGWGVWGGLSERERRRLRHQRQQGAA